MGTLVFGSFATHASDRMHGPAMNGHVDGLPDPPCEGIMRIDRCGSHAMAEGAQLRHA